MGIGRNIAKLRRQKNWSQKELARRAGVSVDYLYRVETGKCPHLPIKLLSRIAEALDVQLGELYEENS